MNDFHFLRVMRVLIVLFSGAFLIFAVGVMGYALHNPWLTTGGCP